MINPEDMKDALLYEKKRLEIIISAQTGLLETMKQFDGKMFNKKIPETLEEKRPCYRAYIYGDGDRKQLVISFRDMNELHEMRKLYRHYDCNENNVIWEMKSAITDEEGKRFSYEKFKALLLKNINRKRAELSAINSDLADGETRLQEAAKIAEYYKQIVNSFSKFIVNEYRHNFQVTYF